MGGTLNVGNADQTTHRTVFIRQETGTALATVQETEAGAVVPTAAVLSVPGMVEVRCDQHPWTHGWIVVFDHPYFTTTDANGAFTIDSVPPGRYQITANSVAIAPGFRNQFNTGLQQSIGKFILVDADYFWKYTHNAYDFSTLLNTTITFPIAWHNSKNDGVTVVAAQDAAAQLQFGK